MQVRSCDLPEGKPWYSGCGRMTTGCLGAKGSSTPTWLHPMTSAKPRRQPSRSARIPMSCALARCRAPCGVEALIRESRARQPYSCIVLKTFSDKKFLGEKDHRGICFGVLSPCCVPRSIKEYAKSDAEYGAHQVWTDLKVVCCSRTSIDT